MRVLICGVDGYLGWPLALHLMGRGHEVGGVDAFLRRQWVAEVGGHSAIPIPTMEERLAHLGRSSETALWFREGDLTDSTFVRQAIAAFRPEAVIQLAECPSAPYSMMSVDHAVRVQVNNIAGTTNLLYAIQQEAPGAHLVKLGTMGEYGTPPIDIPEGFFDVEFRGRKARLPFPRQAGSWYHWSKVHGSNNVMFACQLLGLRATDIMQGVVLGCRTAEIGEDPERATRLDFDEAFGTIVNRMCCQAVIGHPLTLYGEGHQKRGFIPLTESIECMRLAIENPPAAGEYRVFNQFDLVLDLTDLAGMIQSVGRDLGLEVRICHVENPRRELEEHRYQPDREGLLKLGFSPTGDVAGEIRSMLVDLTRYRDRVEQKAEQMIPKVRWDGSRRRALVLDARPEG